jgi:hypothetical protein
MKKAICIISLLILTSCATTTNTQAYIPPSEMKQNSQIIISREDAFLYSGVSANIRLNGNKVGSLAKGASQTFYAPPGRNFISVTGTGSPGESTMSFSTKKGEKYSFQIKPRGGSTALGGILAGAMYLSIEADGKTGGLFSINLVSTSEEVTVNSTNKEDDLKKLKSLFDKGLISREVYEQRQLELLQD